MLFAVDVIRPKVAEPRAPSGTAKLGVLVMLNTSRRSCSRWVVLIITSLNSEKSARRCGGP